MEINHLQTLTHRCLIYGPLSEDAPDINLNMRLPLLSSLEVENENLQFSSDRTVGLGRILHPMKHELFRDSQYL